MTARKQPNRVRTASFALAAALFAVAAARVEAPARSALPQTPSGPAARALAERLPPFMDATAVARPVSSMADPTAEPASEVPLDRDGDAVESRAMAPIQLGVGPSQPARLGRITGLVTDFHSGAPLSNVQIFVVGGYQGTLTRMNGQFDIPDVPAGTYELRALRIGLTTQTQQLTVTAEGAVEANFQLSAQAIGLDEIRSDGILLREAPPAVAPTPAPPRDVPGPVFTPFVVRPAVTNPSDVAAALNNAYPPTLRTAGIGGTAEIWFYVDAEGVTQNMKLNKGSGNEQLDEAAMSAARAAEFSPGMNRDQAVAVWVSMPLTFRP